MSGLPASAAGIDPPRLRQVEVDGVRTRVLDGGSGDPLVLLHGGQFGTVDALESWSLNVADLAERFHVYAFDKLGQGYTDPPRSDDACTYDALLAHTVAVFRLLGVERAHVVGHSRGGLLALSLGLDVPGLVRTVTIVDSATAAPEDPRSPSRAFYEDMARKQGGGPPTRESVRSMLESLSASPAHVSHDFVEALLRIALRPENLEMRRRMRSPGQTPWQPSLERARLAVLGALAERGLPVPTLVLWGADDPSAPVSLALDLFQRIAARTPETELHVLNRAGHFAHREQPGAFNRLVRAFCGT